MKYYNSKECLFLLFSPTPFVMQSCGSCSTLAKDDDRPNLEDSYIQLSVSAFVLQVFHKASQDHVAITCASNEVTKSLKLAHCGHCGLAYERFQPNI